MSLITFNQISIFSIVLLSQLLENKKQSYILTVMILLFVMIEIYFK